MVNEQSPPDDIPVSASDDAEDGMQSFDTNAGAQDGVNRCPRCGATDIQLRASTGMLVCTFCRAEWNEARFDQEAVGGSIADIRGTTIGSGAANIQADVSEVLTLKCAGCGAEVVVNTAEAMAARCHWCRHVLTINEQVPNGAVPDAVLPFALTREQAIENINKFAGARKLFANREFVQQFTPENVFGVYLPYMVVDANASVQVWGKGEVQLRSYTRKQGEREQRLYDAEVYEIERRVDFTVDDLAIESSSERLDMNRRVNTNNIINAIQPFDTAEAVQWNANYLNGFSSEKRDSDVTGLEPVLDDRLLSIGRSQVQESVRGYNRGVRWEGERIAVGGSRWIAMYVPVWLYAHTDQSSQMTHYIAVNGRTGKTQGSVPVSHPRIWLAAAAAGVVLEVPIALYLAVAQ